jgi:hypothetical protein
MPRYPDDALEVAMSDDYRVAEARTGRSSEDSVPAPKEPGFLGRIYNAIMGNKHVETDTPLKRSTQIPTLTDAPEYHYEQNTRPKESKTMTIEDIERTNPGATPEEVDDLLLKYARESRQGRLASLEGIVPSSDIRKPMLPPISADSEDLSEADTEELSEPDTEDPSEADTEDLTEAESEDPTEAESEDPTEVETDELTEPMSGGGRMVLGNAALVTIILAMSVFKS